MSELLEQDNSHWTEGDSQSFINYGQYFIPDREVQIEIICDLIPPVSEPCHIVELGCGAGVIAKALLDRFENCKLHALDGSPAMLAQAKNSLEAYADRIELGRFELSSQDWRNFPWPVHAIVSSLAIHHLDDAGKQRLFQDVFNILSPGGAFVVADVIQPQSELANKVAAKAWDRAVRQRSLELKGDLGPYQYFHESNWNLFDYPDPGVDMPSSVYDQLKWMNEAGFAEVDLYWMKAGHAIFGGRMPGT